jgi:hypothetical protein
MLKNHKLFQSKKLWNKLEYLHLGIHRSIFSMTMAPIDGVRVGDHPLVKRLMSGVFDERPSRRAAPALWDPLKVLSVFQHWPSFQSHAERRILDGHCHR